MNLFAICIRDDKTGVISLFADSGATMRCYDSEQKARLRAAEIFGEEIKDKSIFIAKIGEVFDPKFNVSPELTALIQKYELHPDIVQELENETIQFVHESKDGKELVFEIPGLRDHNSGVYLTWHGSDPKTWALEGIRFSVSREYDANADEDLFTPGTETNHDYNVDEFISWLNSELDDIRRHG